MAQTFLRLRRESSDESGMNMKKQFKKRCLLVGACLGAIIIALHVTAEEEPQKTVSVEPQLLQAKMLYTADPMQRNTFWVKGIR
jgi:hypothetical protein